MVQPAALSFSVAGSVVSGVFNFTDMFRVSGRRFIGRRGRSQARRGGCGHRMFRRRCGQTKREFRGSPQMRISTISHCAAVAFAFALGSAGASGNAKAQAFPNRTITLVIPFAPGGSTSIVGRVIADKMSQLLGQSIVVDNRAGAGGTVGTKVVAKSDPDGYTLLLGYTGTLAIGPALYKSAGYEPRKDFAPIGMIGNAPNSLLVHPSFPAKTLTELIAYAKANPGKVNFGSAGVGTV